jgi:hypothetical protein
MNTRHSSTFSTLIRNREAVSLMFFVCSTCLGLHRQPPSRPLQVIDRPWHLQDPQSRLSKDQSPLLMKAAHHHRRIRRFTPLTFFQPHCHLTSVMSPHTASVSAQGRWFISQALLRWKTIRRLLSHNEASPSTTLVKAPLLLSARNGHKCPMCDSSPHSA